MTPLHDRMLRQIAASGPLPFHAYWALCLFDKDHGYYTTRVPIGADGDFTTAPEISQMFGEMIAAWWLATVRQNELHNVHLVEIGPGRGTLMDDMLRTLARIEPSLRSTLPVHMVEVSPRLAALQREKLAQSGFEITWHTNMATLPLAPLGIVANELFDAIPARPFVKRHGNWYESAVTVTAEMQLAMTLIPTSMDPAVLPAGHEDQPDGTFFEFAPSRESFMTDIATKTVANGGFGLFIDYGHAKSAFGDTVQAMIAHKYANPLESPGEADITSHVDFEALANSARNAGAWATNCLDQGEFLTRIGIAKRADRLTKASPAQRSTIETACDRLVATDKMGKLFKVLGIAAPGFVMPGFEITR